MLFPPVRFVHDGTKYAKINYYGRTYLRTTIFDRNLILMKPKTCKLSPKVSFSFEQINPINGLNSEMSFMSNKLIALSLYNLFIKKFLHGYIKYLR